MPPRHHIATSAHRGPIKIGSSKTISIVPPPLEGPCNLDCTKVYGTSLPQNVTKAEIAAFILLNSKMVVEISAIHCLATKKKERDNTSVSISVPSKQHGEFLIGRLNGQHFDQFSKSTRTSWKVANKKRNHSYTDHMSVITADTDDIANMDDVKEEPTWDQLSVITAGADDIAAMDDVKDDPYMELTAHMSSMPTCPPKCEQVPPNPSSPSIDVKEEASDYSFHGVSMCPC